MTPLASVIVPTRNRAAVLRLCLQSLARQTLPADRFEVIVVDNGSSDDTAAVAQAFTDRLELSVLQATEPGLHVGRHAGWRAARSRILMFCDDDIEASPGWVEAVVRRFEDPGVAIVGGNNLPAWEATPPDWLAQWWELPVAHGKAMGALSVLDFGTGVFDVDPGWVWGCNFNVRAELLDRTRGFHPDGMPKDRLRWRGDGETHVSDFARASGARAVFDGAATVRHRVDANRMTVGYFEQRGYAQGISASYAQCRRDGAPLGMAARWARGLRRALAAPAAWRSARGCAWGAAQQALQRGFLEGWEMHQQAVRQDRELFAWVTRPDYL